MKYLLTGYVNSWDNESIKIGEYNTMEDAQRTAKKYMQNNSYHGYKELEILPIGSCNFWSVKFIYDMYNGWEQY